MSTSDAAWPANRTRNPATAGSADAAASATGGDIVACTAQNQGGSPKLKPKTEKRLSQFLSGEKKAVLKI